jgi:hypothetical protein
MGGPGSGGARTRSGPARNPNSISAGRRSNNAGFVRFPDVPRDGDPPAWPLPRPTPWERARWAVEWRRPIAAAWERFGLEIQVAIYVRTLYRATRPNAALGLTRNAMTLMDQLGLTVGGMAKNRWLLEEVAVERAAPRRDAGTSAKDRLAVITGGVDARAS